MTMKTIFALILLVPFLSNAQDIILPIDSTTNKITFQEVVQSPGISQDELYTRAREWFALTFKSAQDVIQMDDKASGKIIGKGAHRGTAMILLTPSAFSLNYTVSLTVKEGRYRYEITDFTSQSDPSQYIPNPTRAPIDLWATDPDFKNKKGEYKTNVRPILYSAFTVGVSLKETLKAAMTKSATGVKSKDDF